MIKVLFYFIVHIKSGCKVSLHTYTYISIKCMHESVCVDPFMFLFKISLLFHFLYLCQCSEQ